MKFYTIGYEGLYISTYLLKIKQHFITMVIDVRLNPFSRKRGFSRNTLAEALNAEGIKYYHLPELGNPKEIRAEYNKNGDAEYLYVHYKKYLESHPEAVESLLNTVRNNVPCLMCFEKEPGLCHRGAITEYLDDQYNIKVEHL
jgi:uncharacterized protein (DUF488 family)